MKNACAYIRVSTDHQVDLSPDTQKELIFDYCKKNDFVITQTDIFEDLGISGKSADKRPAFNEMIAMCKSKDHPYDAVIVWKFSRFARNQEESVIYKRMLKKIGVDVISVSEPITDDIGGRIAESIFEIMDEYYSINLSQEVRRGMKKNAEKGVHQSTVPYGYDQIGKNEYKINEKEADVVRYIFDTFQSKNGVQSSIVKYLNNSNIKTKKGNKWELKTVKYILENPFYVGKIRWNVSDRSNNGNKMRDESEWIISEGSHEPIISQEQFDDVQRIIKGKKNKKERTKYSDKHWLGGLIKCKHCGSSLVYQKSPYGDLYRCNGYARGICEHSQHTMVHTMEDNFFNLLNYLIVNRETKIESVSHSDNTLDLMSIYEDELKKIEKKEERIKEAYREGIDTLEEYKANKEILMKEKDTILSKIQNSEPKHEEKNIDEIYDKIYTIKEIIECDRYSNIEKNEMLKEIFDKVIYDKKEQSMIAVFLK